MPKKYRIKQGDTVLNLSVKYGLFAETIWDDDANAELRVKREDMNELLPGDIVTIPDMKTKQLDAACEKRHQFRRKGIPAVYRIQIFDVEEPRSEQDYQFEVDGKLIKGKTDNAGILEECIPADAKKGKIIIGPDNYTIKLAFGLMDPITEICGVQKRLTNLGFDCGESSGELDEQTLLALRAFQKRFELTVSGEINTETRDKLLEVHDAANEFPELQENNVNANG